MSAFCHRLCTIHAVRHRRETGTVGFGHLYQHRYHSFAIESERQYYAVMRYVEANAARSGLVALAEHWRWSSLAERCGPDRGLLAPGPLDLPKGWAALVNEGLPPDVLAETRARFHRTRPYDLRLLTPRYRKNCIKIRVIVPGPNGSLSRQILHPLRIRRQKRAREDLIGARDTGRARRLGDLRDAALEAPRIHVADPDPGTLRVTHLHLQRAGQPRPVHCLVHRRFTLRDRLNRGVEIRHRVAQPAIERADDRPHVLRPLARQ